MNIQASKYCENQLKIYVDIYIIVFMLFAISEMKTTKEMDDRFIIIIIINMRLFENQRIA